MNYRLTQREREERMEREDEKSVLFYGRRESAFGPPTETAKTEVRL